VIYEIWFAWGYLLTNQVKAPVVLRKPNNTTQKNSLVTLGKYFPNGDYGIMIYNGLLIIFQLQLETWRSGWVGRVSAQPENCSLQQWLSAANNPLIY